MIYRLDESLLPEHSCGQSRQQAWRHLTKSFSPVKLLFTQNLILPIPTLYKKNTHNSLPNSIVVLVAINIPPRTTVVPLLQRLIRLIRVHGRLRISIHLPYHSTINVVNISCPVIHRRTCALDWSSKVRKVSAWCSRGCRITPQHLPRHLKRCSVRYLGR